LFEYRGKGRSRPFLFNQLFFKDKTMAVITAAMVKELRVKTDAPMMECKKALTEADGNMEQAEEILRVKLGNKATKAASRITADGVVAIYIDEPGKIGAIVELNSETDFVAKNADFIAFANDIAKLVAENKPADVAALSALPLNGSTVDEVRKGLIGKIGENISIRRFQIIEGKGKLSTYIHGGAKIGVIVDVVGGNDEVAHDVAMHIAASKPKALDKDGVDQNLIETERRVAIEKARENGKPEHLIEKIAEGSVNKFLKEVTLLSQPFVKDDSKSVGELLKSNGATVSAFALFVVGEGLEKRNDDFAAEVAAQAAAARA
jgi:elongation factor Ts